MKQLLLIMGATALLVAPSRAQAQSQNDMTIPEFRQVLVDLGSYLDAHKGTDLRSQFEAIPDNVLMKLYPTISNPRQLQSAVAALKQHDAEQGAQLRLLPEASANISASPMLVVGTCPPNSIIDNSSGAACTPAYPDPTNSAWRNMVNPLITFGAFSPSDYASVSSQSCGLTVESNLVQVVAALNGTVTAASIGCSALQAIPVGGTIAAGVCDAAVTLVAVAGAVSQGLLADCSEQDGNVNTAEIDAGFHNTVTIYNALGTDFTTLNTALGTDFTNLNTALSTDFTSLNTALGSDFTNLNTHLTTVDNHIAAEFVALDAHLVTLVNQLTNQIAQGTALSDAELRQVMKLLLTPDGLKKIDPPILTCTGTNCPNVLAACPAAGCSWNNAGPLP